MLTSLTPHCCQHEYPKTPETRFIIVGVIWHSHFCVQARHSSCRLPNHVLSHAIKHSAYLSGGLHELVLVQLAGSAAQGWFWSVFVHISAIPPLLVEDCVLARL